MEWTPDVCWDADITVAAEDSNTMAVAVQLKDYAGNDMTVRSTILAYFATDATGDVILTSAFDGIANGTDGEVISLVTGSTMLLTSEADGDIDITISETEAFTGYLILVMPNGKLVASGACTFA